MHLVLVSLLLVSILLLVAGYFVRVRKMGYLVAGFNPDRIQDQEGYLKWTGSNIIVIGLVSLLAGILILLLPELALYLIAGYAITVGCLALVIVIGEKRYMKKDYPASPPDNQPG
jgi:hypothetical protein